MIVDPEDDLPPPYVKPRKKMPAWAVVLIVIGGVLLFIAAAGAFYFLTGTSIPVTDRDRQVLITAERVGAYVSDFTMDESRAVSAKTRYLDGAYELEYEYESGEADTPLYVSCTLNVEPKTSDALVTYTVTKTGFSIGLSVAGDGMTQEVRNDLMKFGEASECTILKNNGVPVGNMFVCRTGKKVFAVAISGIYFNEPEGLRELLLPALEKLATYKGE